MIHFNFENYRESLLCMLDSCVSLFLEIVFSHKIVGVAAFLLQTSVILPRGCQSAPFLTVAFTFKRGSGGKGTRTPDIQLAKLALYQLSYTPSCGSD